MLLHQVVTAAALDAPTRPAVITDDGRWDFAELDRRCSEMARLVSSAASPGEPVVVLSENLPDVVTALYAVPAAGAVLTPGNIRHTPAELLTMIDSVGTSLVLGSPAQLDRVASALAERQLRVWSFGPHPAAEMDLSGTLDRRAEPPDTVQAGAELDCTDTDRTDNNVAWLIHTSGTTGRAKAVELTHRSLLAAVLNTAIARPLLDDDVYLFPFPLFHVAAYNVVHTHLRRRPVVLVDRFEPAAVLDRIDRHGVSTCSLAPTMLAMLLDEADRSGRVDSLRQLRGISYGAAAMPPALLHRALDALPDCGLAQGYGMTELSGNAVFLSPADHRRAASDAPRLLTAAGRPGPLVAVRVVDDDGRPVASGDVGEIVVRGDQVSPGYRNDAQATADARFGDWLRTGDVGRFDDEGYLHVVDRAKDLVITGGENVASREVEDVVCTHPSVAAVAVVGVPDAHWGEAVCAVVVPAEGAELDPQELIEWTRGKLAGFKRPKHVRVIDHLPLNASGKVDKPALRRAVR